MSFEVSGKVILVTGASSGLGRAVSLAFARRRARVALVGRRSDALLEVRGRIADGGGEAEVFQFDLMKVESIPGLITDVVQRMEGPVEVLINAAGFGVAGQVEECSVSHYRRNFEVNFYAPLALIQAVLPNMKARRQGQIINVTSGVGKRALPGVSAYSATKFALNALSESLRLEIAPFGIDVISFSPGTMSTPFHERMEFYGVVRSMVPHFYVRSPEAVAEQIFKASQRRCREVMVWGPGLVAAHLNYWAPRLLDWLILRFYKLATQATLSAPPSNAPGAPKDA